MNAEYLEAFYMELKFSPNSSMFELLKSYAPLEEHKKTSYIRFLSDSR